MITRWSLIAKGAYSKMGEMFCSLSQKQSRLIFLLFCFLRRVAPLLSVTFSPVPLAAVLSELTVALAASCLLLDMRAGENFYCSLMSLLSPALRPWVLWRQGRCVFHLCDASFLIRACRKVDAQLMVLEWRKECGVVTHAWLLRSTRESL